MKFKKKFKTVKEACIYFKLTSPYIIKVANRIFNRKKAICNGTITKIDFYNIVAFALESTIPVNSKDDANKKIDYIINEILGCYICPETNELVIQGDDLFYVVAAIFLELCIRVPEYKKSWHSLIKLIHNNNQCRFFNLYIKKVIK